MVPRLLLEVWSIHRMAELHSGGDCFLRSVLSRQEKGELKPVTSTPYPSPNEERQKRRSGRGFYVDRGQTSPEKPRPRHSTEYRDRLRSAQDLEVVELGRELSQLASKFPRFRESLFQWRHQVLIQARSLSWKCKVVCQCLTELSTVEDVMDETGLNLDSATHTLEVLERRGLAERCNRSGEEVVVRRDGKPAQEVYWRRKVGRREGAERC